jgi:opacity protein-like surface antigen
MPILGESAEKNSPQQEIAVGEVCFFRYNQFSDKEAKELTNPYSGIIPMPKFIAVLSLFAVCLMSTAVQAQEKMYFSGHFGVVAMEDIRNVSGPPDGMVDIDMNTGFNGGGAIGMRFRDFRLEGEVSYRDSDIDRIHRNNGTVIDDPVAGSSSALSFLGGLYYDIPYSALVRPYVGGALGVARVSLEMRDYPLAAGIDDSAWEFAYKIGGGIAYTVTPRVEVVLDYHYFATLDPNYTNFDNLNVESEFKTHNINLGFRYNF